MRERLVGYSLISLLISMSIGMVVVAGAGTWYQIVHKQYLIQKSTQAVLTRVRTVFQFLSEDLQTSGYRGVRSRDPNFRITKHMAVQYKHPMEYRLLFPLDRRLVFGFAKQAHPFCSENRDVLVIYDIPRNRTLLGSDMLNAKDRILSLQKSGIQEGALVLIADYMQGDLFVTNQVIDQSIFHQNISANTTDTLSKLYKIQDKTEVMELQRVIYYLKPLTIQTAKTAYGLYRKDVLNPHTAAQELVRGITTFSLLYGLGNAQYKNASQMEDSLSNSDWLRVLSVKISLSIMNEYTKQEEAFEFEIALKNTPQAF